MARLPRMYLILDIDLTHFKVATLLAVLGAIGLVGQLLMLRAIYLRKSKRMTWTMRLININSFFALSYLILLTVWVSHPSERYQPFVPSWYLVLGNLWKTSKPWFQSTGSKVDSHVNIQCSGFMFVLEYRLFLMLFLHLVSLELNLIIIWENNFITRSSTRYQRSNHPNQANC